MHQQGSRVSLTSASAAHPAPRLLHAALLTPAAAAWCLAGWPWRRASLQAQRRAFGPPLPITMERADSTLSRPGTSAHASLDGSLREGLMLGFTRLSRAFVMALPTVIPLILILANHSHRQRWNGSLLLKGFDGNSLDAQFSP